LETVSIELVAFDQVTQEFAAKEGEGDSSLDQWRISHREYFERTGVYRPDMLLWCETFRLISIIETSPQSPDGR